MSLSSASLTMLWILDFYGAAYTLGKVALREQMAVDQPFLGGSAHVQITGLLFFLGELLLGHCEGRGNLGERLLPVQVIC